MISVLLAVLISDTVVLTDGQEISGVVTQQGDQVFVQLDFGQVGFSKSEVVEIRRETTKLHEAKKRRDGLDANDVAGRLALARWCDSQNLRSFARGLYHEVLVIQPGNTDAHERLGHVLQDGRWMTEEQRLEATGHVRYGGSWMKREEAEALETASRERREARAEAEIAALQKKIEVLEAKQSEPQAEAPERSIWTNTWWVPQYQTRRRAFASSGFTVVGNLGKATFGGSTAVGGQSTTKPGARPAPRGYKGVMRGPPRR